MGGASGHVFRPRSGPLVDHGDSQPAARASPARTLRSVKIPSEHCRGTCLGRELLPRKRLGRPHLRHWGKGSPEHSYPVPPLCNDDFGSGRSAFRPGNHAHRGQAQSSEDSCLESDHAECGCIRDGCARGHHSAWRFDPIVGLFAPSPRGRFARAYWRVLVRG